MAHKSLCAIDIILRMKGFFMTDTFTYSSTHELSPQALERLFLSVGWDSGKYPEKLSLAMRSYKSVFTAWDGDKLVGLVSAMDDGVLTAYVHYLLVDPEYQKKGIGRRLMEMVKLEYSGYMKICLIAENDAIKFYETCGFKRVDTASPMYYLNKI